MILILSREIEESLTCRVIDYLENYSVNYTKKEKFQNTINYILILLNCSINMEKHAVMIIIAVKIYVAV